jgi:uncharacterized protein YndB with AHSA1/START domain
MTPAASTQSIVVEYELAQSPEKVWRALTEPELLAAWLMPNDLRPIVGHRFTFKAQPVPGWDGVVHCEVLEVELHKRLRYSWCGGSDDLQEFGARLDTVVSWTLTATDAGGTRLRLEHSGFTEKNGFAFDGLGKGWRGKVGERMGQVLAKL